MTEAVPTSEDLDANSRTLVDLTESVLPTLTDDGARPLSSFRVILVASPLLLLPPLSAVSFVAVVAFPIGSFELLQS